MLEFLLIAADMPKTLLYGKPTRVEVNKLTVIIRLTEKGDRNILHQVDGKYLWVASRKSQGMDLERSDKVIK